MSPEAEIREVIERLNEAWTAGRSHECAVDFHPDAVLVTPGLKERLIGREACMQSYSDFLEQAVLHEFSALEPAVDVVGETAVAICPFKVHYEIGGHRWRESGRDILVFVRAGGRWLIAW